MFQLTLVGPTVLERYKFYTRCRMGYTAWSGGRRQPTAKLWVIAEEVIKMFMQPSDKDRLLEIINQQKLMFLSWQLYEENSLSIGRVISQTCRPHKSFTSVPSSTVHNTSPETIRLTSLLALFAFGSCYRKGTNTGLTMHVVGLYV